ncbi:hypothetical protein MPER_16034, partial [Moniliophthora perniciosa FA553]
YPCTASILTIIPNNTSGHYKRATCIGLLIALANCGNICIHLCPFVHMPGLDLVGLQHVV